MVVSGAANSFLTPPGVAGVGGLDGSNPQLWVPGFCLGGLRWHVSQHAGVLLGLSPVTARLRDLSRRLFACGRWAGGLKVFIELLARASACVRTPSV